LIAGQLAIEGHYNGWLHGNTSFGQICHNSLARWPRLVRLAAAEAAGRHCRRPAIAADASRMVSFQERLTATAAEHSWYADGWLAYCQIRATMNSWCDTRHEADDIADGLSYCSWLDTAGWWLADCQLRMLLIRQMTAGCQMPADTDAEATQIAIDIFTYMLFDTGWWPATLPIAAAAIAAYFRHCHYTLHWYIDTQIWCWWLILVGCWYVIDTYAIIHIYCWYAIIILHTAIIFHIIKPVTTHIDVIA